MARLISLLFVINLLIFSTFSQQDIPDFDEEICVGYDDGELFQIQGTCTLYYYCVDQIGYKDDCKNFGEEYQFDPNINDCNLAEEVGCVEDETYPEYPDPDPETDAPVTNPPVTQPPVTPPPATIPPPVAQTTQTQPPPSIQTTTSNPNNVPDIECPLNKPNELIFLASEDCSEYYICTNGVKYTMKCMEGFVWNPDENQCDHPVFNPRCSNLSFDPNRNVKCNRHGFYTAAYPQDCSKFVFCSEGIPMVQVCPVGTAWHIDRCVARQYAICHDVARFRF